MSIRKRIARSVAPFGWAPIGFNDPQDRFSMEIDLAGQRMDVTNNLNCAALVPLTLITGLPEARSPDVPPSAELHLYDTWLDRQLGSLKLRSVDAPVGADPGLKFFEVEDGRHSCLAKPRIALDRWLRRQAHGTKTEKYSFAMDPESVGHLMIFYICPRPVVLVSVSHQNESNIFPMDLLGPIGDEHFSLALRNTSHSVETMKRSRRLAMSSIPAAEKHVAYRLGVHHKKPSLSLADLPFDVGSSPKFGLPVPATPLRIRELEIDHVQVVGSHTLFVGHIVSDEQFSDAPQLFHTAGFHEHFQARYGTPFLRA